MSSADRAERSSPGSASSVPEVQRYRVPVHGGGVEEIDRHAVRDRIRAREIGPATELALAGTDVWKTASAYPELSRYFELVSGAGTRQPRVSTTPVYDDMGHRLVAGLGYPLGRGGVLTILGLALFSYIPALGLFAGPIASVYALAVVRESANGDTTMPGWFDTADLVDVLLTWLKTVAVTLIAAWPVVLWTVFWFSTMANALDPRGLAPFLAGLALAGLASLVYYPACLATVAVWHSVVDSLNPVYVARVVRTVGTDYLVVVAAWMAVWVGTLALQLLSGALFGWVPIFGELPARAIGIWGQLYVAHLLGYAIHRHSDELGWS